MVTRVKDYRTATGMTQDELADLVEVRRETVVFLQKRKYNPSLRPAYRIARVLGAAVEELFSFDDEEWDLPAKKRIRSSGG